MGWTRDAVSYYGLDNTNTNDINPTLFADVRPDLTGEDVCVLTFPAGTYKHDSFISTWLSTVSDLTINLTGATLRATSGNGVPISSRHLTQVGIDDASGQSARIQTANVGATSVELTAASASAGHISRFSVGQYIMVCGWATQGTFQSAYSFPPNFHWSEYRKITGIAGNVISFTDPLQNFYDENWPELNRGNAGEVDAAGPATIFAMHPDWDGTTTVNGGNLDQPSGPSDTFLNCYRREFTANGVTCDDSSIYPSVQHTFRAINCTSKNVLVEVDKNVDLAYFEGGSWSGFQCQSSSIRMFHMDGVTIDNRITGTPRNAVIDDCTINSSGVSIGPFAYGRGETFTARNSTIPGTISGGYTDKGPRDEGVQGCLSMSGSGVITIPMTLNESVLRLMMPDSRGRNVLFWSHNSYGAFAPFKSLSVTSDRWPAADIQTSTTNVTMSSVTNTRTLSVSSSIFASGDVGKVVSVPGAGNAGGVLWTFITAYSSPTSVTVFDPCLTTLSASSKTVSWGTCNYYVQTDQTAMPDPALYIGSTLNIFCPAARSVSLENCTGSDDAVDLSQVAARGRPLGTYTKRAHTGTLPTTDTTFVKVFGRAVSVKINVTKKYDGVGSLTFQFVKRCLQGSSFPLYFTEINLKTLGERIITVSGATGSQAGDTLGSISDTFFTNVNGIAKLSRDVSGESSGDWPEFTLEVITDQGFPVEIYSSARTRLRVR